MESVEGRAKAIEEEQSGDMSGVVLKGAKLAGELLRYMEAGNHHQEAAGRCVDGACRLGRAVQRRGVCEGARASPGARRRVHHRALGAHHPHRLNSAKPRTSDHQL
jgi:hypothetical protein